MKINNLTCEKPNCNNLRFLRRKGTTEYYGKICRYHYGRAISKSARTKDIGTERIDLNGYTVVKTKNGWVGKHRIVMEQKLDRKLVKGETVHHKDGNRSNNNLKNLELWAISQPYGQRVADLICPHCNKPYIIK